MRIVCAPDKFRGTATAAEICAAVAAAAAEHGASCVRLPMSDGGEGLLEAMGGANRCDVVSGPWGQPVAAAWRLDGDTAVLESARAIGRQLAGGGAPDDPVTATTRGVGELIVLAARAGASTVRLGLGGSATTDGGAGAVEVIEAAGMTLGEQGAVRVEVGCDVTTVFTDAARVFGPQKGADADQVARLTRRLRTRRDQIRAETGLDLDAIAGSGAAGGLAGGLAALGARLRPGFEMVAEARGLDAALADCDLVVTGEGQLDATSLLGKVVGGVVQRAGAHGLPVLVVVGRADASWSPGSAAALTVVDLTERFGAVRARAETTACVQAAVAEFLRPADPGPTSKTNREETP